MGEVPLAPKYSAEIYARALSNLVERWKQKGGKGSIKYNEAAIGMDKTTVSTALKFLGEIGLLEVPKAGSYIVPESVLDYRTKMGNVKRDAKQEVAAQLDDYPLYKEAKFLLSLNDFTVGELAENVSGYKSIAAEQGELNDVERSLKILAELEFLEIDEEGSVSIPADLEDEAQPESPQENAGAEADAGAEAEGPGGSAEASVGSHAQQPGFDGAPASDEGTVALTVDMDIFMDATDMGPDEIREKLEAINGAFGRE